MPDMSTIAFIERYDDEFLVRDLSNNLIGKIEYYSSIPIEESLELIRRLAQAFLGRCVQMERLPFEDRDVYKVDSFQVAELAECAAAYGELHSFLAVNRGDTVELTFTGPDGLMGVPVLSYEGDNDVPTVSFQSWIGTNNHRWLPHFVRSLLILLTGDSVSGLGPDG
ncbi:MAG: hypothetical protein HOE53_04925, partial [Candidatus Magasanikbacteria bacterium]|nr:hypothetical protein [Candidatus Magasanikbacteria bacterium]